MENSMIPELRFPEFEGKWKRKKIGDISKVKNGFAFKGEFFGEKGPYIILTPGNFDVGGGFRYQGSKEKYYTSSDVSDNYILKKGDLLTVMTEQAVGLIGSGLIVPESGLFLHNQRLGLFEVGEEVQKEFLFHFMKTHSLSLKFSKSAAGTKVRHTSVKLIEGIDLSIPILPEQTKIASFLTTVDKRINLLQKKKAELELYKKGIMQKIVSQTIRFKDENGNDFPDWEENKLNDICDIKKGQQLNKEELEETGTYPAINGGIEPSGYTEEWNSSENTITISEGGNSCGYVNYIRTKFWSGGHCYSLLRLDEKVVGDYLYQSLRYYQNQIMRLRVGSGLPNIQKRDINNFKLLLPKKEEQLKIANFLSSIDKSIEKLGNQIDDSVVFKQGLLQKMFV
ncbi:restriction endonuclease subunit S [Labilibaculum euxinus]